MNDIFANTETMKENEHPRFYTAESVMRGHPDKLCDLIADSVLDACLQHDPASRVACEVMATHGHIIVAGEITTSAKPDVFNIVRDTLRDVGYDPKAYQIDCYIHDQSPDIAGAVEPELAEGEDEDTLGAGDQGVMVGYACDETPEYLPMPVVIAQRLVTLLEISRMTGVIPDIGPDGKVQVTMEYNGDMTSNMTLMNEEIADYIASKPTFSVLCSIDGPQEIHDEHRKTIEGKGSFEKAIAGVRKLVEARKRHKNEQPIIFSAVLTPPYTREKFEKINTFMAKLEWLPKNSMVEVSYVSYESKKSHYIPINERPENKLENEKTNWNQTDPLKSWRIFSKEDWSYEGLLTQNYLTKPLNVIHRRKISNEPFKYYTMNGCCIPGARKAFIRTNGDILPCERIGTIAPIGNVFTGFDFKNIEKNYYEDYVREAVRYCGECWAVNICTKCHQDCMDKDGHVDFDYRHANCEFERSEILLHLKIYHELLEHNPEQIQRLNEIDIT